MGNANADIVSINVVGTSVAVGSGGVRGGGVRAGGAVEGAGVAPVSPQSWEQPFCFVSSRQNGVDEEFLSKVAGTNEYDGAFLFIPHPVCATLGSLLNRRGR